MDLSIDIEKYRLNIRAGAIIIHNNKLLAHKNKKENYYAIIGGRVKIGEDSESTIKREIKEELGKDIEIIEDIAIVENFFNHRNSRYHEILFIYKVEFTDENDKKIENTLKNIEGENDIQYEWLDLNKIEEYPILPETIKTILKENKFPVHKINKEIE